MAQVNARTFPAAAADTRTRTTQAGMSASGSFVRPRRFLAMRSSSRMTAPVADCSTNFPTTSFNLLVVTTLFALGPRQRRAQSEITPGGQVPEEGYPFHDHIVSEKSSDFPC